MTMAEAGKQDGNNGARASEDSSVGTDKSLDSLLSEWGESSSASPETGDVVGRVLKKVEPVIDFARSEAARRETETVQKDLDAALDFMIEPDEFKDFPKFWVKGYLEAYSAENPTFADAFDKRDKDPEGWRNALSEAREKFAERAGQLPGSKVRSDVEAAKAAVSGTSTERLEDEDPSEQEQATDLLTMSESDFKRWEQKELAKAASGR